MLTHEEMIENVHRRIAQYEEEQKMKHSKDNKFFSAKTNIKEEKRTNEDEYIEVVSGTDNIRTKNNVLRIVSSVAAAALLITGIGATGYLMHKNKENKKMILKDEVAFTEATEADDEKAKNMSNNSVTPFGDFDHLLFRIGILNQPYKEYSDATYDKIADYLNGFDWGQSFELAEEDIPDFDVYEGSGYCISWEIGDMYSEIYITEDGKVYYLKKQCIPDGGPFYYPIIESAVFDIDYDSFDKDVKKILDKDIPNTGDGLSEREIRKLCAGEYLRAEIYSEKESESKQILSDKAETNKALEKFLEKDFLTMLKRRSLESETDYDLIYTVDRYYKSSATTERRDSFYIYSDGSVALYPYEIVGNEEIPTGADGFYIDIEAFEKRLDDIMAGKYDEVIPEKKDDKKQNNDKKQDNVQPTTEKPVKQEATENQTEPENAHRDEQVTTKPADPPVVTGPEVTDPVEEEYYDDYNDPRPHVTITDKYDNTIASSLTHDHKILDDFVANTFQNMLTEIDYDDALYLSDVKIDEYYFIFRTAPDEDNVPVRYGYSVSDDDRASLCAYRFDPSKKEWEPCGAFNYQIDFAEFKKLFEEAIKAAEK